MYLYQILLQLALNPCIDHSKKKKKLPKKEVLKSFYHNIEIQKYFLQSVYY